MRPSPATACCPSGRTQSPHPTCWCCAPGQNGAACAGLLYRFSIEAKAVGGSPLAGSPALPGHQQLCGHASRAAWRIRPSPMPTCRRVALPVSWHAGAAAGRAVRHHSAVATYLADLAQPPVQAVERNSRPKRHSVCRQMAGKP